MAPIASYRKVNVLTVEITAKRANAVIPYQLQLHTDLVDQAMWIWMVHDLNPRALAGNMTGYVEAQSWFQDLTPVHAG